MQIRCPKDVAQTTTPEAKQTNWWSALFLFGVLALVVFVRLRWLEVPLERDEGEYAYLGQLILEGVPPYKLAFNIKFPGIYIAYAGIMALFGQTTAGIHLGFLCVNLVSILLVFLLGRQWWNAHAGALAAGIFGLLSLSPSVMGQAAHATHFVVLTALAGFLVLSRALKSDRLEWVFLSGILFGVSCLMKQPGLFFGVFGMVLLAFNTGFKTEQRKKLIMQLAVFCLGWFLPICVTGFIMWWCGVFNAFWFWTVTYAVIHGNAMPLKLGIRQLARFFTSIGPDIIFWFLAVSGLVWLLKAQVDRIKKAAFAGLFLFSFLVVMPGLQFSAHYFVAMLPACALLGALAIIAVQNAVQDRVGLRPVPAAVLIGASAVLISWHSELLFHASPAQVSRRIYGSNPFPEAVEIADYIASRTLPEAHIGIIGSEPEIFFYAHRRSATKYIYTYDLIATHRYALGMQKHMAREIETIKPAFLIVVNLKSSLSLWNVETPFFTEWLNKFVESYRLTGVVDLGKGKSKFYWNEEISTLQSEPETYIAIYSLEAPVGIPHVPDEARAVQ